MSSDAYLKAVENQIVASNYNINGNHYNLTLPLVEKESIDELVTLIKLGQDSQLKVELESLADKILKAVQAKKVDQAIEQSIINNAKAALESLMERFPFWGVEKGMTLSKYL
ncbi:MAG: hypothetical protein V4525_01505 [Pseudomonadota bacterium]